MRILMLCVVLAFGGCAYNTSPDAMYYQSAQALDAIAPDGCVFRSAQNKYQCDDNENPKINNRVKSARNDLMKSYKEHPYFDDNGELRDIVFDLYHCRDLQGNKMGDKFRTMYCETRFRQDIIETWEREENITVFESVVDGKYKYVLSE